MSVPDIIMEFMRNAWARIAAFIVQKRLKSDPDSPLDFIRVIQEPQNWLLIMPVEANAFDAAVKHCREYLADLKRVRFHLLVPQEFQHWVETSPSLKVHPFDRKDLFLNRFPRRSLLRRLRRIDPTVVLDLSPSPTPLSLSVSGLCGARIRGALSRSYGDAVFNLLIKSGAGEIGDRYRALFAYLS